MKVTSCMKRNVISIRPTASIRDAATLIIKNHIGLLPVLDENARLIGVIGMRDLLKLEMPAFVDFMEDVDFVHDFGAVEDTRPTSSTLKKSASSIMRPVASLDENCGLLRAYALMLQQNLHDIPVVSKDGKLTGIASRVDIGVAILSTWFKGEA